jgi:hypothetical protein
MDWEDLFKLDWRKIVIMYLLFFAFLCYIIFQYTVPCRECYVLPEILGEKPCDVYYSMPWEVCACRCGIPTPAESLVKQIFWPLVLVTSMGLFYMAAYAIVWVYENPYKNKWQRFKPRYAKSNPEE